MRRLLIAACLWALCVSTAVALQSSLRFSHLGVQDGLSHGAVKTIVQDREGFIWIGTSNGLNRFDGLDIVSHYGGEEPGQLDSDYIRDLFVARDATLWAATATGLSRYDSLSGRFTNFPLPVAEGGEPIQAYQIAQGDGDALWVGTGGLGLARLDPDSGEYRLFRHQADQPSAGPSSDFIYSVLPAGDGSFWLGHRDTGLDRFDPNQGLLGQWRHQPADSSSLSNNLVYDLLVDHQQRLWVATRGGGLNRMRPDNDGFDRFSYQPDNPLSLVGDRVWGLMEDRENRLWVVTESGVSRHRADGRGFDRLVHDPLDTTSLGTNAINAVAEDSNGMIWFGTYGSGVSWVDPSTERFGLERMEPGNPDGLPTDFITAMAIDGDSLWLGTTDGLLRRPNDEAGYDWFAYDPDAPNTLNQSFIRAIFPAGRGRVWLGTDDAGLVLFDPQQGVVEQHLTPSVDDEGNPVGARSITAIDTTADGTLWLSSRTGLFFRRQGESRFRVHEYDESDPNSLPANRVVTLLVDDQDRLWVGTTAGLALLTDSANGRFQRFQMGTENSNGLTHNTISILFQDSDNTLWVGTFGGGLHRLDTDSRVIRHVSQRGGLSGNSIQSIEEDNSGHLWVGTATGLFRFDPETESALRFSISDGLQADHFEHHASARDAQGRLYFGGAEGFNRFQPDEVTLSRPPPPTVITEFQALPGDADGGSTTQGIAPDAVRVHADQRILSIRFAALSFTSTHDYRYRYRMIGLDSDWQYADALRNRVTWSYLPSGDFEFIVQASGQPGEWGQADRLRINKAAPFWLTAPALLLYALAVALIIGLIVFQAKHRRIGERRRRVELKREVRNRTRTLRQRNRQLKLAQNQLMTQEKMASLGSLVAGVSHEINTPLGIGVTAASQLQNALRRFQRRRDEGDLRLRDLTSFEDTVSEGTDIILRNLRRATELMRSFKQVAVDQAGEQYRDFDLASYIDETLAALGPKLRQGNAQVEVHCSDDITMSGYPGAIYQILANLTLNSLIHGFAGREESQEKRITIEAKLLANDRVELRYSDNGRGMDEATLRKVFDPFFTTRMGEGGSGLGMHIVYNLCTQLLNGSIDISSQPGEGLSISMVLPRRLQSDDTD